MLPPETFPVAETTPIVVMLPPETLPVAETMPAVVILPPDTLPVAETTPVVVMLPPETLPVAETMPDVPKLPTLALPVTSNVRLAVSVFAVTPSVRVNELPVAAPIFGVVRFAPSLTTTFPPTIAVVLLSTLTLNTEPFSDKPLPA